MPRLLYAPATKLTKFRPLAVLSFLPGGKPLLLHPSCLVSPDHASYSFRAFILPFISFIPSLLAPLFYYLFFCRCFIVFLLLFFFIFLSKVSHILSSRGSRTSRASAAKSCLYATWMTSNLRQFRKIEFCVIFSMNRGSGTDFVSFVHFFNI